MKANSVLAVMTQIRDLLLLQKNVLNISEICSYTGFERSYIYKLTSQKKIPHFKSAGGKTIFFKRDEIDEWLTQNRIKTNDQINQEALEIHKKITKK